MWTLFIVFSQVFAFSAFFFISGPNDQMSATFRGETVKLVQNSKDFGVGLHLGGKIPSLFFAIFVFRVSRAVFAFVNLMT